MGCLLSVAFGALSSQAPLISGLLRPSGKDSDLLKLILSSSDPLKLTFYRCSSHFLRCRRQKM
ncbi:unnamed protein product [Brassica napus]|uniref:(rape) hypothetical protein n=1 Tax=Brassica napus TaxID=3708 RepID=A0A816R768_BRANA|nr:unnamed protein product [Brassica napus]